MSLAATTRLGPYEIVAPIGAGGMGEVYRARDPRIGREVAIKVVLANFANDPERLRRFEQEVRAVGALNHPNILTIYDIGNKDGSPYVVCELLEGETLRARLEAGAIPQAKAVSYAIEMALGLAAAHDKGIVHRDLKPENIFLTEDGRVKILDFGLAKLVQQEPQGSGSFAATMAAETEPGTVMGTAGYMAPEQVRGRTVDHRSDLFTFGAILHEMLTGKRAFLRESAVETMSAILKEEPPEASLPLPLERIIRRCLEKSPAARFQTAADLAFALESLSGPTAQIPAAALTSPAPAPRRVLVWPLIAALVLAAALGGVFLGMRLGRRDPPSYHQLTFRRGTIQTAKFAPDGQTIVYGAAWDGKPNELFSTRTDSPESRSLGLGNAEILSISTSGEMAILVNRHQVNAYSSPGTLARVALAGGAPREVLADVLDATWSPDGKELAVVRAVGDRSRLEFPPGKLVYETAGLVASPSFSPRGDAIAFVERSGSGWLLSLAELGGKKRTLGEWLSQWGMAWHPSRDEIWVTGSDRGMHAALYAVTREGKRRLLDRVPGTMALRDIARSGQALLIRQDFRSPIMTLAQGERHERDLSWQGTSWLTDLSPDGKTILFLEAEQSGAALWNIYLRQTDGSAAIRLGTTDAGFAALSPDGRWVLTYRRNPAPQLLLLPTKAGESRALDIPGISEYAAASWFPDGKRILITGAEAGHGLRMYVWELAGGKPRAVGPEGAGSGRVSPDGRLVAADGPDQRVWLYSLEGGEARAASGAASADLPIQWSGDGRMLYVARAAEPVPGVYRLELSTGRAEKWLQPAPADPAGAASLGLGALLVTPDGKSYCYNLGRLLSELYLVDNLN